MLRKYLLVVFLSVVSYAQTYSIFINSFSKDTIKNAQKYQIILDKYLKLNNIQQKTSLILADDSITIKIINFSTLKEAKTVHNKIKKDFKNSFIQENSNSGLEEIHRKAMKLLETGKAEESFNLLLDAYKKNNFDKKTLFLLGISAKENKDLENAIKYFEEILKLDSNAHRIRLDLADLYYQDGQYEKSNENFLIVKSAKIPKQVEKNIENYKIKKRKENQKNYNLFASIGYMKDSNVNLGPDIDSISMYDIDFTLSSDAKRSDDDAYTYKASGTYYNEFKNFLLESSLNVSSTDYSKFDDYDSLSYSISSGPIFFTDDTLYKFPISYTDITLGVSEDFYLRYFAFYPSFKKSISSSFAYTIKLNFEDKEYESVPTKDGTMYGISYGFEVLYDKMNSINFNTYFNRSNSQDDIYSYNSYGVDLLYTSSLFSRLLFVGKINYEVNSYDEPEDAFEVKKDENNLNGTLSLIYDLNFYNSSLIYTYYNQYNSSNIDLYKYRRTLSIVSLNINF